MNARGSYRARACLPRRSAGRSSPRFVMKYAGTELKERSAQHYVAPFDMAVIYLGLGAKSSTFEWLEKAYDDHSTWLFLIKVDPRFDTIRDDPRYRDLLQRMRIPE